MEGKENIRVEVRDRGARQEEEKAAFVTKIKTEHVNLYYGERQVLKDITFDMGENKVTAFIGPSGCGKSSYLRCLNRMNDFISSARVEGTINIDGENILAPSTDVIGLRRKVGMVFQKPNPFPMSIYDNIAYGPRLNGIKDKDKLDEILDARKFIGRAPSQVTEFIANEIDPILAANSAVLGKKGEVKV